MRIDTEVKLNYSDVLIRPKRSTLSSRRDVDLHRPLNFRNYRPDFPDNIDRYTHYSGVPVMAANMDGVGTIDMANELRKSGMFTCLVKSLNNTPEVFKDFHGWSHAAVSTGITESDLTQCEKVLKQYPDVKYICIDVANGYSERFIDFVADFRERWSDKVIIAGNVVTPDITEELILKGADIVKVGIGPGCFLPGTIVNTVDGPKPIEEVKIGDMVKTHTGAEKPVIDTLVYDNTKPIISINGIKSTDSHEYYVLHKKYKDIVNDENVHKLAEWLEAKELTKDYLLLRHK